MQRFLSNIDQFGAEEKLQIHPLNPIQRSVFGGVMTLILYGSSLAFFLSQIVDWAQNNKLPKITSYQQQIDQAQTISLSERILEISFQSYNYKKDLDPFDSQNLIFFPVVRKITGYVKNQYDIPIKFESVKQNSGLMRNTFYLENQIILGSPPNQQIYNDFIDYQILIAYCEDVPLPEGFQCADEKTKESYFSQVNYLNLVFYMNGYDSKKKDLYKIPKYYQINILQDSTQFYYMSLKMNEAQVDDGILFSNSNIIPYISDFTVATQSFDYERTMKQYFQMSPLIVYLTLDQIKEVLFIEYPKISEILADTGSIISWILQVSFIVFKYNEKICSEKTIKGIISLYYPDFEKFNMNYNIFGKCTSVFIKDKKYDPDKATRIVKQLTTMAQQKVNFLNLQYEIFRIQYAISSTLGISSFKNIIHQNGFENLMDNLGYKIEQPVDQSSINLRPQIQINNELLQESMDQDKQNLTENLQSNVQQTMGLLIKDQIIIQDEKNNNDEIEKQIFPKEDLKVEDISRLGSKR